MAAAPTESAARRSFATVPVVYGMFFVSGAASLIYQIIWIRKFSLVLGGTVFSMSVVISTFMAGIAIGAAVLGRLADRVKAPLMLYAVIELAIGASAIALNFSDGVRAQIVAALIDTPNLEGTLGVRIAISVLWLGLPCFLIGGTLPVMVRFIVRRLSGLGRQVGALYFINTLGAAAGALVTGVALVEVMGLTGGTLFAASINALVAVTALVLGRAVRSEELLAGPLEESVAEKAKPTDRLAMVAPAVAFFFSGFSALVLEMGWTRLILGFLQSGVLVVSINLCVLLLGFALGGIAVSGFADSSPTPSKLASLLFAVTGLLVLVGMGSVEVLGLLPATGYVPTARQVAAVFGIVFPASVGMGATFPVLARILVTSQGRIGSQLGGYYALNTLGTVVGGIVAPFVLIPAFGVSVTVILGAVFQLAVSLLLFLTSPRAAHPALRYAPPALILLATLFVPMRWAIYHRTLHSAAVAVFPDWSNERAYVEGADSTVVLYQADDAGQSSLMDASKFRVQVNASTLVAFDTAETKLMAHLPLIAIPHPKRALIICFGVGNTYRSALAHDIDVDVVDINPAIPGLARFHQRDPSKTFDDPRGHIYINDGRNFLQVTRQKYDMITIDPAPPVWGVGLGNIQSREFYQLISDRLTDTGVAEAWMISNVKGDFVRTLAAWRAVFPHVAVFNGVRYGGAYHVLGSRLPIRLRKERMNQFLLSPRLRDDVGGVDARLFSPGLIRAIWVTDETGVDQVIKGVEPLTDDRPVLEYRTLRGVAAIAFQFPRETAREFPVAP